MHKIASIVGPEPQRPGEDPDFYQVGRQGVTHIEEREQNFGTYGILWLEVYTAEGMVARLNAMHVANTTYQPAS
jgi:hypothetical protein